MAKKKVTVIINEDIHSTIKKSSFMIYIVFLEKFVPLMHKLTNDNTRC